MDSYTENEFKKGQTAPDLFVMVPFILIHPEELLFIVFFRMSH